MKQIKTQQRFRCDFCKKTGISRSISIHEKGEIWIEAKQEPYYQNLIDKVRCFLGIHQLRISEKYRGTEECLICGKRKVGLNHY